MGEGGRGARREDDESESALRKKWGAPEGSKRVPKPKKQFDAGAIQIDALLASHAGSERIATLVDEELGNPILLVRPSTALDLKGRQPPTVPASFKEAMTSIWSEEWAAACSEEIAGLEQQDTWTLVQAKHGDKILGSRWHFSLKTDPDGNVAGLKARLVVQGVKTLPWLEEFGPRSAPLAPLPVIFLTYGYIAEEKLYAITIDFRKGYLAAPASLIMAQPILMRQPPGFEDKDAPNAVCLLKKALYGLPQSGRAFFLRVKTFLEELAIVTVSSDVTLYHGKVQGQDLLLLAYVDDGVVAGTQSSVEWLMGKLNDEFDIQIRGPLNNAAFLGRQISYDRDEGVLYVSARASIIQLLKISGLETAKGLHLPIQQGVQYRASSKPAIDCLEYLKTVGHLHWITPIRPDIAYAVGLATRFSQNPGKEHWSLIRRIIRYLKETLDVCLQIAGSRTKDKGYSAFTDADHAGCIETRRSTSGVLIFFNNSLVFSCSKRQSLVTLSTLASELVALAEAFIELEWLDSNSSKFRKAPENPILIKNDNQNAITAVNDATYEESKRVIDTKIRFMREQVQAGFARVQWIEGNSNPADLLTKALPARIARKHAETIGLVGFPSWEGWGSR